VCFEASHGILGLSIAEFGLKTEGL
jgi:hypothetical protein